MKDDARTPEQKAADEALNEAVQQCALAYGVIDADALVMDFVISGFGQSLEDVEKERTSHFLIFRHDDVGSSPIYTAIGLVNVALSRMLNQDDDES